MIMALKAADDDVLLRITTKTRTPSSLAIKNYKNHDSSTTNIDDSTASNSTAITTITTSSSGTSLSEWAIETAAEEDSNSNSSSNVSVNVKTTATNISDGTSTTIIQKQTLSNKEEETKEGEVVIGVEKRKKNVIFSGIKIREYKRSIGDNPTCICGPPLGLDWSYIDIQFDKYNNYNDNFDNFDNSSENRSSDLIPLDEYEKFRFTGYQKRRSREIQYQNEKKLLLEKHSTQKQNQQRRRNSTGGGGKQLQRCSTGGMSSSTTQKEQIKQIKMKFLKLQPITSYKREQIILKETNCTKQDVINTTKKIKVIHNQRQSTAALSEIGLGADNNCILPFIEYIQRKIRRYKSGISKQREQELLWENASNNASNNNASNTKNASNNDASNTASNTKNAPRRSSISNRRISSAS
ncbi:hypothetical protein FRACYDRAFT_237338 [Fragilariopsis cylindrus CCMP1102]|uniref:Uncharacterized protein n=1 Tax=Fragilariopsis cylindrus CCMP1102 TaxID=635003 RepID=A0A1E7FLL8_9STRA|nr:hypothetical protein FRACYDRAFT_237338 [Fragilariopsis cylindrus CCMP1102]|eukprot:OEU19046.1 hypothetical protein FRACYDRAFT_237338 [Fragilariopsis cylindrus CCMP1102]